MFSSRFSLKDWSRSSNWLGDLYNAINLQLPTISSNLTYSFKKLMSMILKESNYCTIHQHLHRGGDGWSECNKLYLEIFKFLSSGKIFESRFFSDKGESLIDFRTQCVIMTQRIDSFQKAFLNVFRIKKAYCIFEELSNLYLFC